LPDYQAQNLRNNFKIKIRKKSVSSMIHFSLHQAAFAVYFSYDTK